LKIVVATKNKGKINELEYILRDLNVQIVSQRDMNIDVEVEEDGTTFEENALKKATEIMKLSGEVTLADDSGLEVDYLNGAPRIFSARYAGEGASDADRNNKLLAELKDVPFEKRTARFVCVIAAVWPDGRKIVTRGECHGIIHFKPVGNNGFGYDPIFFIPEYNRTMAELNSELKNKISHRAKAMELFKKEFIRMMEL